MQDDVRYLIDADDKATAKFIKLNRSVEESVKHVREVGGQAKASTELVGTLASSLGASGIGGFAGEIAMLTERVSAFSEVSKAGGAGALAFKAGLAGAAAVISVKVGEALGNVIWQTDKWTKALESAQERAGELASEMAGIMSNRLQANVNEAIKLAETTGDQVKLEEVRNQLRMEQLGLEKQISSELQKKREAEEAYFQTAVTQATIQKADADIKATRAQIKALRDLQIATSEAGLEEAKRIRLAEEAAKQQEQSTNFLDQLKRKYEAATMSAEELLKLEIERSTVAGKDREEALRLANELALVKQVADAEKKADQERLQRRKEIIESEKKTIQDLQSQMAEISRNMVTQSMPTLTAGSSSRLATGAGSEFRKTAAVIEAERQTDLQTKLVKIQDEIAKSLKNIEKQERIIKVIGD